MSLVRLVACATTLSLASSIDVDVSINIGNNNNNNNHHFNHHPIPFKPDNNKPPVSDATTTEPEVVATELIVVDSTTELAVDAAATDSPAPRVQNPAPSFDSTGTGHHPAPRFDSPSPAIEDTEPIATSTGSDAEPDTEPQTSESTTATTTATTSALLREDAADATTTQTSPTPSDMMDVADEDVAVDHANHHEVNSEGPAPFPAPAPTVTVNVNSKHGNREATDAFTFPSTTVSTTTTITTTEKQWTSTTTTLPRDHLDEKLPPPEDDDVRAEHRHDTDSQDTVNDGGDVVLVVTQHPHDDRVQDEGIVTDPMANHKIGDMNGEKIDPIEFDVFDEHPDVFDVHDAGRDDMADDGNDDDKDQPHENMEQEEHLTPKSVTAHDVKVTVRPTVDPRDIAGLAVHPTVDPRDISGLDNDHVPDDDRFVGQQWVTADGPEHILEIYDEGRYENQPQTPKAPEPPNPDFGFAKPTEPPERRNWSDEQYFELFDESSNQCCTRKANKESSEWKVEGTVQDDGESCARACAKSYNDGSSCVSFQVETAADGKKQCYLFYVECEAHDDSSCTSFTYRSISTTPTIEKTKTTTATATTTTVAPTTSSQTESESTQPAPSPADLRDADVDLGVPEHHNDVDVWSSRPSPSPAPSPTLPDSVNNVFHEPAPEVTDVAANKATVTARPLHGFESLYSVVEFKDCSKGDQDPDTYKWSNVIYASDRDYVKHAAGFEPSDLFDCFTACEREPGCQFFWYEETLPDLELTQSGRYCELHQECSETRKPGWPGTSYRMVGVGTPADGRYDTTADDRYARTTTTDDRYARGTTSDDRYAIKRTMNDGRYSTTQQHDAGRFKRTTDADEREYFQLRMEEYKEEKAEQELREQLREDYRRPAITTVPVRLTRNLRRGD